MQEIRSNEQSIDVKEKLYYVSQNYIVQDNFTLKSPTLIKRNGGGSQYEIDTVLKICGMKIISQESEHCFKLEVIKNGEE